MLKIRERSAQVQTRVITLQQNRIRVAIRRYVGLAVLRKFNLRGRNEAGLGN
jgi:hypothetical protein